MRTLLATLAVALVACGAEADETAENALGSYRVDVKTAAPVTAGAVSSLTFRVFDPNDAQVRAFDLMHTEPMHFVAVSSDLKDFLHLHPALQPDGSLAVDAPFAVKQPYNLFFEYDPKGPAEAQTSRGGLAPIGAGAKTPELAREQIFDGGRTRISVVGDTRVELPPLAHPMIMPGATTTLRVAVKDAAGQPVTDLVNWMEMPGHALLFSEDASVFIHAHGVPAGTGGHGGHGGHDGHGGHGGHDGGAPAPVGGDLDVDVNLPRAGLYKMFMQVKRGERVITAPFVLRAMAM
jgi:hypothetical protein